MTDARGVLRRRQFTSQRTREGRAVVWFRLTVRSLDVYAGALRRFLLGRDF